MTQTRTATTAGQVVVRCASGTFWFDGWCLDSHSTGLVVEFQDEQTQTSARDLAVCLAQKGGAHRHQTPTILHKIVLACLASGTTRCWTLSGGACVDKFLGCALRSSR